MRPCNFKYVAPLTTMDVCDTLSSYGSDARIIAGGQSLAPLLNMRLVRPRVLVDIGRVDELRYIKQADGMVAVGAGTSQRELERNAALHAVPVLKTVLKHIGHVTTRNRGTVGGTIAYADPAAELPLALVTLGGTVALRSTGGVREVAGRDFFRGPFVTALREDEVLAEVRFPVTANRVSVQFEEVTPRTSGDAPIVAVMVAIEMQDTRCQSIEIGISGVADTPLVVSQAATEVLIGATPTPALLDAAATACTSPLRPGDDLRASGAYKRQVARALVRRVLERVCAELTKGGQS